MAENKTPENHPQQPPQGGYGYGYGYGGYYYNPYSYQRYNGGYYGGGGNNYGGYEGGDEPDNGPKARTFRDYVLVVRERFWYLVLAVFICTASALIYIANRQEMWMAVSKLRVYRHPYSTPGTMSLMQPELNVVVGTEDFNTQIEVMRSLRVIDRVSKRLTTVQKSKVLDSFREGNLFTGALRDEDILARYREVTPQKQSLIAQVSYMHPDQQVAQQVAQLFAEEIREFNKESRQKLTMPVLEVTAMTLVSLGRTINDLYAQKEETLGHNPRLLTFELKAANKELSDALASRDNALQNYQESEGLWNQLNEMRKSKRQLTDMATIAHMPRVMETETEVSRREIALAGLREKYKDEHPQMVAALQESKKAKAERDRAISEAVNKIEQGYQMAKTAYELAVKRYETRTAEINALTRAQGKLEILNRQIEDQERLRSSMQLAHQAEKLKSSDAQTSIVDVLEPAMLVSTRPINKNYFQFAALGAGAGVVLGFGIIFGLAALDDRVKSAEDIERFLGLPLIGILPIARRLNSFKKARIVATGDDRAVAESFRTIYSVLKINELARTAKVFLTTSTTPSEGKSFVTTNLAMTYAQQGEKVLIIDGDLRMPVVSKTLQLEGGKGISYYFKEGASLDDSIYREVIPNLDVLPAGHPSKNAIQVLGSRQFAEMIVTLKGRYDRIFIDSAPIGAVSDGLNLLSQVDGLIFVVRFNTVKRRFIRSNVLRLREAKVPIFGAVLNHIGIRVARYYTNTGDRSYSKYYARADKSAVELPLKDKDKETETDKV
ncbi:MAG: polysaccharide biosynthesis tyrosine autokinase [Puniceicoccales bacterium]|jgi:capsular exopolysaccharide synthesis family protein|nr:polysaccharide biosynthesis tyrosine autokinase [Puniceicoccales bacterium]